MTNNTNKEKWINEVLGSTKAMQKAMPRADLYERVMAANTLLPPAKAIPFPLKQWAAAAVILLALNVGSVVYFNQHKAATHDQNPFAAAMQMQTTYDY